MLTLAAAINSIAVPNIILFRIFCLLAVIVLLPGLNKKHYANNRHACLTLRESLRLRLIPPARRQQPYATILEEQFYLSLLMGHRNETLRHRGVSQYDPCRAAGLN